MKIQLASDLHFECHPIQHYQETGLRFVQQTDADVLVLAGDIINLDGRLTKYLLEFCQRYPHVVYVPGNHEYWGQTIEESEAQLRKLSRIPNLHILSHITGYEVTIEGQRFVGDTLWVPDTPDARMRTTNDPQFIPGVIPWLFDRHEQFKHWLVSSQGLKPTDVLVTHYMPSYACVSPRFRGFTLNAWFVGDIEPIIFNIQPKLVLFGHTHDPFDQQLGDVRFVCNPGGYPAEWGIGKPRYDKSKLIDLP